MISLPVGNIFYISFFKGDILMSNPLSIAARAGLKSPGDKVSAEITKGGNKVLKMSTNNGVRKYAAVQYKNGTIVETKVSKK